MLENITDEKKCSKLKGLQDYLQNNRKYLVNYGEREKSHQVFTSQVAESHIDSIINARHKRKQKRQWTREGWCSKSVVGKIDFWLNLVASDTKPQICNTTPATLAGGGHI